MTKSIKGKTIPLIHFIVAEIMIEAHITVFPHSRHSPICVSTSQPKCSAPLAMLSASLMHRPLTSTKVVEINSNPFLGSICILLAKINPTIHAYRAQNKIFYSSRVTRSCPKAPPINGVHIFLHHFFYNPPPEPNFGPSFFALLASTVFHLRRKKKRPPSYDPWRSDVFPGSLEAVLGKQHKIPTALD